MTGSSCRWKLALAVLGCLATLESRAVAGGCSYSLGSYLNGFMPDFDQKRGNGPLVFDGMQFVFDPPGLPSNGSMYCVPTSHLNTMGYLANHGFPGLMPGMGSSPAWSAPESTKA